MVWIAKQSSGSPHRKHNANLIKNEWLKFNKVPPRSLLSKRHMVSEVSASKGLVKNAFKA